MTTSKANEEEKNPAAGGIAGGLAQASGTGKDYFIIRFLSSFPFSNEGRKLPFVFRRTIIAFINKSIVSEIGNTSSISPWS